MKDHRLDLTRAFVGRDWVNIKDKMLDITDWKPQRIDPYINKLDLACCWIVFAGLVLWAWYAW